jgi:hypothetical protein
MNFTPKSEEELAEENLLQPGIYDFEVATAEEKVSKKGNAMIEMNLKVFHVDGSFTFVRDWLLDSFLPKLLAFCKETGLREAYDSGTLKSDDLPGKFGKVELEIKKDGDFPAKNAVKRYGAAKGLGGQGASGGGGNKTSG